MANRGRFGPGALVTAAFIGPGTVTVCTLAGVNYGYSLIWVMLLSVAVCYLLQEMAARLGMVSRRGLGEAIRCEISHPGRRRLVIAVVIGAIVFGNAAYEAGNISGSVLGLNQIFGIERHPATSLIVAAMVFALLFTGSYRVLERVLISLVVLMSLAFVTVAIATGPAPADLLRGLVPRFSAAQTLTVIGLVGTTVVPYNLFLHARIVQEKWHGPESLPDMRRDALLAIALGGFVSVAIMVSAAAVLGSTVSDATELSLALEPVFGSLGKYILAFGLFAAGITSAITAPLAASYVASGCLGWNPDLKAPASRVVWATVLLTGLLFSLIGGSPVEIIRFAQVANGIVLPLIAGFVLWAVNRKGLLGTFANGPIRNLLGFAALGMVMLLALRSLWLVVQSF